MTLDKRISLRSNLLRSPLRLGLYDFLLYNSDWLLRFDLLFFLLGTVIGILFGLSLKRSQVFLLNLSLQGLVLFHGLIFVHHYTYLLHHDKVPKEREQYGQDACLNHRQFS